MKKVLFATTALVASTGIAAAQSVDVSGSAEMGIIGGQSMDIDGTGPDAYGADFETQFLQSVDVDFTMSGTADNGLTFGASIDLDDVDDSGDLADSTDADYTVFISGQWGTLTMGDTDGALDFVMSEVALAGGSIADNETAHAGYRGSYLDGSEDGQILRYDYSFGDFTVAFSVEADDDSDDFASLDSDGEAQAGNIVSLSPFSNTGVAGAPLATPVISLTATGDDSFEGVEGWSYNLGGINGAVLDIYPNGLYDIQALDFDLNPAAADGNEWTDGDSTANLTSVWNDGVWESDGLGNAWQSTNVLGAINTLLEIEAITDGVATQQVDLAYALQGNAAGTITADQLSYLDESDTDFAIGLEYSFDTGMGSLTVGGGYQQGGTVYASRLMVDDTVAGTTSVVASGTDLVDPTGAAEESLELWEMVVSEEQTEIGISATYAMTNGFSVGVQFSEIENFAAQSYGIAVTSTGAVVTNAMFSDATHWGLGAAYEWDAWTFAANYGRYDLDAGFDDREGWGAVANYDFGGGLEAQFGYGWSDVAGDTADNWSFGMSMSF